MEKGFQTMAAAIDGIMGTLEWDKFCRMDPTVQIKSELVEELVDKLMVIHPESKERIFELNEAMAESISAYIEAAILYGISIAIDISAALENPIAYLQYIAARRSAA